MGKTQDRCLSHSLSLFFAVDRGTWEEAEKLHSPFPHIHAPLTSHLIPNFSLGPFSPANYSFSFGGGADACLT